MLKGRCACLIQNYNHWPHPLTETGVMVTSLLRLVCDALELCLLPPTLSPSLPNFPPSAQLFIFSFYNSGSSSAISLAVPPPPTHPPKGRKARLWPSAWWARTAVCSGITPAEKGGIPSPGTFVRCGHCLLLTRQLFKPPRGPHGWG